MVSLIWGLIGTVIGASVSIITTHLNNQNNVNIQKGSDNFKRAELFREFQRDNLLQLQEKLSFSMRLIGRAHFEDLVSYKETNKWQSNLLGADLDKGINESFRELSIKAERIDNDELRNEVKRLKEQMEECLLANNLPSRKGRITKLTKDFEVIMSQLGEVLRANYL